MSKSTATDCSLPGGGVPRENFERDAESGVGKPHLSSETNLAAGESGPYCGAPFTTLNAVQGG